MDLSGRFESVRDDGGPSCIHRSPRGESGLYNGFLAAGLIWGLFSRQRAFSIQVFFLACVLVAGIFGAYTAKGSILLVQALPAAVGLCLVTLTREANHSS